MSKKLSDVDLATPVDSGSVANKRVRARSRWRWPAIAAAGLLLGSAACTLLLDRSATQCASDGDCAKFGAHPFCVNSVCVDSGLGPAPCFFGTPSQQQDFQNQCTTATEFPFDNCVRIKLCPGSPDPPLVMPPDAGASAAASGIDGGPMANCLDPDNGRASVVFMTGSSNFPPLLMKLAPLIIMPPGGGTGPTPVFQVTNSCTGVKSIYNGTLIHDPAPGAALSKYAAYFDVNGTQNYCLLGSAGAQVDVGESDIYAATCSVADDGNHSDQPGPIQAMAFVVPGTSTQTSISAEAAREVFGMGGNNGTTIPWIDPMHYYVRNVNTGTQQLIGHAIDVPADQFWGIDVGSASAVDQTLKVIPAGPDAEKSIGIISVDYYDSDRQNLNALAFKATGQETGFLPDSTISSTDKKNVRDGHYPIWGPLHFFTSNPPSQAALSFLSVLTVPKLPKAVVDAYIAASLVPPCAMEVTRTTELGPLSEYHPSFRCGCYFDAAQGNPRADCTRCMTPSDCPSPGQQDCSLGFCENH